MLHYCNNVILLAEPLCGPERLRGHVEVPGGKNSLAEMFWQNISTSRCRNICTAEQIRYDTGPVHQLYIANPATTNLAVETLTVI